VPPGLPFKNSTFRPHSTSVFFVLIKQNKKKAITAICNIKWLVFIVESECVYHAVRTKSSNVLQVKFRLQTAAPWLWRSVARHPLGRVRSRVIPCYICCG